jgi:DNA-binding FrmR family transcriptional regulator
MHNENQENAKNVETAESVGTVESIDAAESIGNAENTRTVDSVEAAQESGEVVCGHCSEKTKDRTGKEYKDMINRLSRIEGQVRGIKNMVEKDAYCTDILVQVAAVNAALNSFNRVLLANHIKTCVSQDIRDGKEETVDELIQTLKKLMK